MGLIQRVIEARGIPTVGVSIARRFTEAVRPPRTVLLEWPFGHPMGEPHHIFQQATVIGDLVQALAWMDTPGAIHAPGYRWGKTVYSRPHWLDHGGTCDLAASLDDAEANTKKDFSSAASS